jgi:hypothetical protein
LFKYIILHLSSQHSDGTDAISSVTEAMSMAFLEARKYQRRDYLKRA